MTPLPSDFITATEEYLGKADADALFRHLDEEPVTSIRLNPFKPADMPFNGKTVGWCPTGRYLETRPAFTFDPLLHAGVYYVQEAASMFLFQVLNQYLPNHDIRVLDLCAAPGGKSTLVRSMLSDDSLLVCNEPVRQRAMILSENIQKFGHPGVIVTNNYPADFQCFDDLFDVIIADVPCSGEGMFRKDHNARDEWSIDNVNKCFQLQRSIIDDIWHCLRPGGLLVYSTCTFNIHENEKNIEYILHNHEAETLEVNTMPEWGISGSLLSGSDIHVYRFMPGRTKSEGLFMSAIRKPERGRQRERQHERQRERQIKSGLDRVRKWLNTDRAMTITVEENNIYAIPTNHADVINKMAKKLKIVLAGIHVGMIKGKDIQPQQSLALSIALAPDAFPRHEVDYDNAIHYLRRETISLPADTPRGYVIITYHSYPLGFVKNIGNRCNNLYPNEWRIRKQV